RNAALRAGARAGHRARRQRDRRGVMDRRFGDPERLGPGGAAGLGAGARPGTLHDRFFGCLTIGSTAWGQVAVLVGVANAHFLAAAGAGAGMALPWGGNRQPGGPLDLSPSMHGPAPRPAQRVEHDRGPVLVPVESRIAPADREPFLEALARLEHERRR